MKVLIINLATATERMALQKRQMAHFGFDWERIEAATPDNLDPPDADPYWNGWQRPLRPTEKAAMLTHLTAWRRVAEAGQPALILEDDALLAEGAGAFVTRVEALSGLDHVTLETRGRKKLIDRSPHAELPMHRLYLDRSGAAAYVLFPSGAAKLIAHVSRTGMLADAAICSVPGFLSWQAVPALAIQLDQCARYGVPQPIAVTSAIDAAAKPPAATPEAQRDHRRRRLSAQLSMGLRQLSSLPRASRRHVLPASQWPDLSLP